MARAVVIAQSGFFDNMVLRLPGEEFDIDPDQQYDYTGEVFRFIDPADQRRAEEAYRERGAAKTRASVRGEIQQKIRADAEARLRARAEGEVKAELAAESEKV